MIFKIVLWSIGFILLIVSATFLVDYIISAPGYSGPKSNHFNGTTFKNLNNVKARGLNDVARWAFTGDPGEWEEISEEQAVFQKPPKVNEGDISITFVNHATFLIQIDGMNILTDPIWSRRASPFSWIGPKRMRPPGVRFEDLPEINAVLISHNHYDHLDLSTVQRLQQKFDPIFITPLGVSNYLEEHGISRNRELDWWQRSKLSDRINVSSVPAQHFSGRGLTDRDKTLWSGYVIESELGNVYFAGDTGYDGFFKEIGQRFGPIKTALIPIGAFRPRWFMKPIHVNPDEAVKIHKEIKAEKSIGIHFGTFPLGDDGMHEPVEALQQARKDHGIPPSDFITLQQGETRAIKSQTRVELAE